MPLDLHGPNHGTLRSNLKAVAEFEGIASIEELASEPGVFSASPGFAKETCGPLTRRIFDSWNWDDEYLEFDRHHVVVDTRIQRLMPGMYPSIPGWHLDGVPRNSYDAQPDLSQIHPGIQHYLGLIATSENVSNTEFLDDEFTFYYHEDEPLYKQLHIDIERMRKEGHPPMSEIIQPGTLYRFDQATPHRCLPCVERGWRLFFRLSISPKPPLNKPRGQEQVYILSEENGW